MKTTINEALKAIKKVENKVYEKIAKATSKTETDKLMVRWRKVMEMTQEMSKMETDFTTGKLNTSTSKPENTSSENQALEKENTKS